MKDWKAEYQQLQKRFQHLMKSEFIASFDQWSSLKRGYERDINEADRLTGYGDHRSYHAPEPIFRLLTPPPISAPVKVPVHRVPVMPIAVPVLCKTRARKLRRNGLHFNCVIFDELYPPKEERDIWRI